MCMCMFTWALLSEFSCLDREMVELRWGAGQHHWRVLQRSGWRWDPLPWHPGKCPNQQSRFKHGAGFLERGVGMRPELEGPETETERDKSRDWTRMCSRKREGPGSQMGALCGGWTQALSRAGFVCLPQHEGGSGASFVSTQHDLRRPHAWFNVLFSPSWNS